MSPIRIFLAEDHTMVRESLRDLIEREKDMEVVGEAVNGEEAVHLIGKLNPHVVLMDVAMPVLNGIEATRRVKKTHPLVSVLILSAFDNEEFVFAVLDAKARDIWKKIFAVRTSSVPLERFITAMMF